MFKGGYQIIIGEDVLSENIKISDKSKKVLYELITNSQEFIKPIILIDKKYKRVLCSCWVQKVKQEQFFDNALGFEIIFGSKYTYTCMVRNDDIQIEVVED